MLVRGKLHLTDTQVLLLPDNQVLHLSDTKCGTCPTGLYECCTCPTLIPRLLHLPDIKLIGVALARHIILASVALARHKELAVALYLNRHWTVAINFLLLITMISSPNKPSMHRI